MDRFLIVTNKEKDINNKMTDKISGYIKKAGKFSKATCALISRNDMEELILSNNIECVIVLGGDGTIIKVANDTMAYDVPLLGVNLGTLGFLAEIETSHVLEAMDDVFAGNYKIEERLMLKGKVSLKSSSPNKKEEEYVHFLNDAVISRKGYSRIISLDIYVNGELVNNFEGDGVIIATPTGSTAYNLSAGGPIIIPDAKVTAITPICPHTICPRSIVVSADDNIKVVVGKSKKTLEAESTVTFDGNKAENLGTDDVIEISRSKYKTKVITLNQMSIYETLRTKLGSY